MKLRYQIGMTVLGVILLLCFSLTACAPTADVTPSPTPTATSTPSPTPVATPTPEPMPKPTPTPEPTPELEPWEADPTQFILDCLEADFMDGRLALKVALDTGSMPATDMMYDDETGQTVRDLFAAYGWELTDKLGDSDNTVVGISAGVYSLPFETTPVPWEFSFSTYSDVIALRASDWAWNQCLYFRADGAENLCRDLLALSPNPETQACIVYSQLKKTAADTGRQFLDDFFASMTENGHITDYQLLEGYVLDPENMIYRITFRLKPTHPEWHLWSGANDYYSLNASGWTETLEWRFWLETDGERCRFWV